MFACYCITANSFALAPAGGSLIALDACRKHGLQFWEDLVKEASVSQLRNLPHNISVKWYFIE